MIIKRTQRVWAFLTVAALVLMTLGSGLFAPLLAQADSRRQPVITVNFDFDSLPKKSLNKGDDSFDKHVWIHQWLGKEKSKDIQISKETKSVTLSPLNGEKNIEFIVYIGKSNGTHPETIWHPWGHPDQYAQTANIKAYVGRTINVNYGNLTNKAADLPAIPEDKNMYMPELLECDGSIPTVEQMTMDFVMPSTMFKMDDGEIQFPPASGKPTLKIVSSPFPAEVTNNGYIKFPLIPSDAQLGKHEIQVEFTYADGTKQFVDVPFIVTEKKSPELKSQLWKLSYADTTVQQLKSATVDLTATLFGKERALPRAVTFAKGADMLSWANVDAKTGTIALNPNEFVAPQDYEFTVAVTHLDGKVTSVPVKVTVTKADNAPELKSQLWKLSYTDTTVQQLKSATVDLTATLFGKERALPRAVTFAKGADMPSWANVDAKTGTITLNPDEFVAPQDYEFTVAVTHLDGKVTSVPVKVTVTKADNAPELKSQLWKLSYADTTVQQQKSASVDLTATLFGKERALPRAVTFAKGADMPSWANVDTKTGTITLNPDEYVELKDYVFHVVVTHLDGKTEKVAVKIKVTEADPETTYPLTPLKPGKHTIPALELTPAQPIAKPHTPKPVETPSTGLAKTGVDLAGLAGLALISALAGATVLRRRHAE